MKKLIIPFLLLVFIINLVGCTRLPAADDYTTTTASEAETTTEATEDVTTAPSVPTAVQQPMAAVSVPPVTETSKASDGTTLFSYTYQNISLTLPDPDVADKVIVDFLNRIDSTRTSAESVNSSAYSNYKNTSAWTPYMFRVAYDPMRIDHGVLSLFGSIASYSGTPHPENICVSASYDLVTGEVLTLGGILTEDCSVESLSRLVVNALSAVAEEKYLYDDYADIAEARLSSDWVSDEDWYFSQNGLCFYFSPYQIAPYASGVVTAEIPYAELVGLLNDAYFPAERDIYNSTVTAELFENADLNQFTQFSEIVLHKGKQKIILYADQPVYDIRLEEGSLIPGGTEFASSHVVFAASSLTPGDAIMIEASISQDSPNLRISYRSGEEIKQAYITIRDGAVTLTEE